MQPHTHGAISLGTTGNIQGSVFFFCLQTGQVIKRRSFTELPMQDSTIKQVEKKAEKDKVKEGLTFRDQNKMPFTFDDDVDTSMTVTPLIPTPYWEMPAEFPGVNLERHLPIINENDGNNTMSSEMKMSGTISQLQLWLPQETKDWRIHIRRQLILMPTLYLMMTVQWNKEMREKIMRIYDEDGIMEENVQEPATQAQDGIGDEA